MSARNMPLKNFTELANCRFPGLLYGYEELIWNALLSLPKNTLLQNDGKQLKLREALEKLNLGWIATNTTPYRVRLGKFIRAAQCELQNISRKRSRESKISSSVRITRDFLPDTARFDGPLDDSFCALHRERVTSQLRQNGAVVIRNCVKGRIPVIKRGRVQKLRASCGNGLSGNGTSFYSDMSGYQILQEKLQQLLQGCENAEEPKKCIYLSYCEGAENWAHQDNNTCKNCPYQAMLLLSRPGVDFSGGDFYIARKGQDEREISVFLVPLESQGDLVIFQASKRSGWFHGVTRISKGTSEVCRREAVGLLHPR
mmetsp:Transcript_23193/g.55494  ORF Transcript_23193/g.55494 Transcript_23193/m.55494 type:complete len:314 (+) Transcript_23193:174-1115(+)